PVLVDRFRRAVVDALALADSEPDRVADERWQDSLRRDLSQLLFEIVQAGSPAAELLPPPSTRGYIVDKSIEYMRAHLVSIDGLADVCRHVRVSPRTLRYSFEEILGVPPLHYLLMLKLRGIRAELQLGAGAKGIYRVAERYGFCHMGRFALFYQQAFGELPSETCRQTAATRARAGRVRRAVASRSRTLP
ncbi:MAG: helix-turn-helix transcriptional regulator, partial [Dehalococcoidia bacterium]